MAVLAVILYPFPTTTLFSSIAFRLEVQPLREHPFDLPKLLESSPNALDGYCTNSDEATDV